MAFSFTSLSAQSPADSTSTAADSAMFVPWRVGFTLGANYNFHQAPQAYTTYVYTLTPGLEIGLSVKYYFKPWLGVRADLLSMMRNYTQMNTIEFNDQELSPFAITNLNSYVLLPVMADFSCGKRVRFHGNVGFYLGYWTNMQRAGANAMPVAGSEVAEFDETTEFNKERDNRFTAGIATGLGMSFPMGKHLEGSVEANCLYDLTDSKKVISRHHFPHYNTTLTAQLGLAYKF